MLLLRDTRVKPLFHDWGVWFPICLIVAENNLFIDVISEVLSSFPDTLQHQVCSELPHCVTFRLFASVFTKALCLRLYSFAVSDPIANWFSMLAYFGPFC
jgi:hypothetical protein